MRHNTLRASLRPRRLRNRAGFTLVEVIVAAVILTAALLAMAGFSVRYQQIDSSARIVNKAQQAANSRLELVRIAQPYSAIDTMATTESTIPNFPGYTRTTAVTRMGGNPTDTVDYKIITVTVTTPGVARTVKKTSFVGAF
jgi:prepilin-type N-terminal cleavage/methylation domain-containing protein